MAFDLKSYYGRFGEACEKRFGRRFDLTAIEREFSHLREGKDFLQASDVYRLFDKTKTPFSGFWPAPEQGKLRKNLAKARLSLALGDKNDRELVQSLLAVFHNLGIVSLVLRFTHPERFGIFSTPVAELLLVHCPSLLDLYIGYCHELERWRKSFELGSVAQTEMALWAFHELTKGHEDNRELLQVRRAFEEDVWVQQRRVAQVFGPFLRHGALKLAEFLVEENPNLAAMVAGREYERLLKQAAKDHCRDARLEGKGWRQELLARMLHDGVIKPPEFKLHAQLWITRTVAVHGDREMQTAEVAQMIASIRSVCVQLGLDHLRREKGAAG